jgi:hypothetical protein
MGRARRHHLISKGHLRAWSHPGKHVALITKAEPRAKSVGISDAFVVPRLLTFQTAGGPSDQLEVAFGRVESAALPHVRRFVDGAGDGDARTAVKALSALHWARSQSIVEVYDRIYDEVFTELVDGSETDFDLHAAFAATYGRPPSPGELRGLVSELTQAWRRANNFFADRVQTHYRRALDHFGPQHVRRIEIVRPTKVEFVIADSPVVLVGGLGGLHGTATRPCPLYEATSLWFPLAPHVGSTLTPRVESDQMIVPADAQTLNMLSWRYAKDRLAGRPRADLDMAFGFSPGRITRGPS